ncbi:hypothetical protein Efla_002351 [Eimeria flavescens]
MRGFPGLELLIAALTPGLFLLCVLQWLAGTYRLKWCVAFEQVGMGAVLSVLLAVGLELLSALLFGSSLRACTPAPSPKTPFAAAGTAGSPLPLLHLLLQQQQRETGSRLVSFLKGLVEADAAGCGVAGRGVAGRLVSYVAGGSSYYRSFQRHNPSSKLYEEGGYSDAHAFLCVGFIFAYMIFCIGFAEELSKAAGMLLLRPSRVPSVRSLQSSGLGSPGSPGLLGLIKEVADKEDDSMFHFVAHPTSIVVAGCCAALGFATVENLSYVFATKSDMEMALATAWVRAFTAIPSHVANTGIAACFLANAAAHTVLAAATAEPASISEAGAAAERAAAGDLEGPGGGVHAVGEVHTVEISSGSSSGSSDIPRPSSPAAASPQPRIVNPFSCRRLLQSALLPGVLHGCYDAALTLASAAYTGGVLGGNALIASCWLMIALVSWWTSIIMFCNHWCSVKRLQEFYFYFSRPFFYTGAGPSLRPAAVAPRPGPSYFADSQQQLLLLQQQLLHQQFVPIQTDAAAWQQQQQQQPQHLQQQQQHMATPMYRQYAPVLYPPLQQQQQQRGANS